jgi:hypothetical protein
LWQTNSEALETFCFICRLLLRDFGLYGVIFTNVVTVAMVMLLRNFETYGMIFMTMCVYCCKLSRHSWRAVY